MSAQQPCAAGSPGSDKKKQALAAIDSFTECLASWNQMSPVQAASEPTADSEAEAAAEPELLDHLAVLSEYSRKRRDIVKDLSRAKAELLRQQSRLDAHELEERDVARAHAAALVKRFLLTADDLFPMSAPDQGEAKDGTNKIERAGLRPPKYRNGAGQTWSGRGPRPPWLKEALLEGHALQEFAIQA